MEFVSWWHHWNDNLWKWNLKTDLLTLWQLVRKQCSMCDVENPKCTSQNYPEGVETPSVQSSSFVHTCWRHKKVCVVRIHRPFRTHINWHLPLSILQWNHSLPHMYTFLSKTRTCPIEFRFANRCTTRLSWDSLQPRQAKRHSNPFMPGHVHSLLSRIKRFCRLQTF